MSGKITNIQASILDRLIDQEPGVSHEPVQYRLTTFSQVKAAVVRDLENLFNTKNFFPSLPSACPQLSRSLFVYGLPDFTSVNPKSPSTRHHLRQRIEEVISQFEPRLRNVAVRIDDSAMKERNLRFKITALLVVDPVAEQVTFDTSFDVNRSEYSVQQ
jgi:type VI secretion system protein ImpF